MNGAGTTRMRRLARVVALVAMPAMLLAAPRSAAAACLSGGDERTINAALQGPGAKVALCAGAVFVLNAPVVLSADGQELATEAYPTDATRALLRVAGPAQASAITSRANRISIRAIAVDGARPALGPIPQGAALIEIGGDVSGIRVDAVHAQDPRGWSSLHVFEGSGQCDGATITNSDIGPAGTPDGHWADGISFGCRNGLIAGNIVTDASDGGIVIFGAPGTLVQNNLIRTRTNTLLGGINLVDYKPFDGDYTGTIVSGNRIEADGGYIKVAIAIGPAAWGEDKGLINHGGTVSDNVIAGKGIGYGIVVSGVSDFTIQGNQVQATLGGRPGPRCPQGQAGPGQALVLSPANSQGRFQSGFVTSPIHYAICVDPS